jgi:RNA recognition motif-containing protein
MAQRDEGYMKLYVGNLPYSASEDDLKQAFEPHGQVESTAIIMDRNTGQSKGFGFVEMSSKEEAESAIEALNGQEFQGRKMIVNEARPKQDRGGSGGGRGGRGGFGGGGGRDNRRSW